MDKATSDPVTMSAIVRAFSAIADKLGVTLKDYFTDNDLTRVGYAGGVSNGSTFEASLLKLASALALGSRGNALLHVGQYRRQSRAGHRV